MLKLVPVFALLLMLTASPPPGAAGFLEETAPRNCTAIPNSELCLLIGRGSPDLPAKDSAPYQKQIRNFYAAGNYEFAWVRAMRPSPQALALIQRLQNADQEGLRAQDYDAALWDTWLARLNQSTPAANAELARFDLALTVTRSEERRVG